MRSNKTHSVEDFKVQCFESWPEYINFLSTAKTSTIGSTWQWPDGIARLLSPTKNELLTESKETAIDRKNARQFIEKFKSYDKRHNVAIKIGNSISVISSSLDLNKKSITVRGYLTPRIIAAINYDVDGSIDCIEFDNGDQFPERNELTMVEGQYILNTIFFSTVTESEEAHTKIWMDVSRMEGQGWKYSNKLEESTIITKGNFNMNKSNKNTPNKVDESFFSTLENELKSFAAERASLGKVGAKTIAKGSGTADDPYLGEDASRYTMVADMIQIAEKLDKPVHFVHEGHGYVATIRGVMESEEFEGLDDLDEAKVSPGTTKDEHYGAWILRYDLRPATGSKEYRGKAWHAKSTKTPPIALTGSSVDDVRSKLVATIDSTKSQKAIDPSKRVMIDFNVLTTKDIIGHKDAIYGDVELIDNMPTLLISAEQPGGFQVATDRTSVAQRAEHKTGQHAFSLSGKKAIAAGLTHARYALGAPFDYSEGVTAYPLKFSSEVHPGEVIRLNEPGVTVAYPRDVSEEVNEDGVFEGIFSKKDNADKYQELTSQQRDLIRKFFAGRGTNVDVVYGDGQHVLPHNALGHHNNTVFRFYNESGKLMCNIEYYRTAQDAGDIKAAPLTHISDVEVKGPWDLEALMKKYGGEFNESDDSSEDIVEDNGYQFEGTANELYAELKDGMLDIVDEYKGKAVKGYSQPAAPDSTKFSAAVGGMIEYATNVHIHGGRTSFPKTYKMFIKVGSAVDEQTKNDINTQFAEYVNVITGKHLDETITTDDGYRFSFGSEEFTNWGGIGVMISPPKARVSESNEVKFVTRDITNVKELHEHTEQKAKAMFEHGDISLESYKGTTRTDGSWKAGFAQRVRSGLRRLTNESASHTDIKSFIDRLKQVDLSPNGKIEKGQKLAVINFDIIFAWEEIELSGFTTPKTIVDITWTPDKTIKLITFDDGDTYPRHNKVTYHGKPTDYSVFFQTQEKAESTLTMLTLALPDGWEITDNNINSKKVSEATEGKAKIRGYKDRNGVKKYEVLNADGVRVKGDMSKEMADDYLRNHRSELQEGGTNAGIIKVNMTQMKKWKVDQDNVRYYDHIIKNKGSIQTLDTRPYLEYLNQFGIFYTGPNINEDDYSIADMDPDYEEEEEPNVFYVAIYDEDENTTFVGKLSNGGRKWQESNVAGTPPYNWPCHGYMGYLSAGDVMSWIYKDYSRGYEVKGPFYSKDEAIQWAKHNFGPLGESQVSEAKHGMSKRVRVVAGPAKGKMGYVGEIRHGAYKGAPKEYTIDLDDGGNVRCSAKELRLVKDEPIEEGYWDEAMKKFEKDSEARKGKTFEKNPLSHDKNGVYKGDKDLDGNPVKKVDEAADPQKKIASLEKQYDTLRGRLGMAKDRRRMKGDRLLSPAEQKIMSKMSEVQSQIYQLKADANKAPVDEAIKFSKGAYPDVDHMNGSVIRDWGDTPKKQVIPFKNRSAWETTAQKANSELYDDNAEIISMGVLREYEIDGKVFARWIETTSSGWVQTTPINESVVTEKSKSAKQARFMAAEDMKKIKSDITSEEKHK